jgi:opacity protein-like surface antigen
MKRSIAYLFVLGMTVWPAAALAQSPGASAYFSFGTMQFAASESFDLITGSSTKSGFGVGGTFSRLWRGLFADASFWQHKPEGERVFVDGGATYQLGIPVRVTFRPIDVVGGWKYEINAVQPYVGGGLTFMSYKEESDFATSSDDVDERKTGAVILVGVDVPLGGLVRLGGEYRYRSVSGVLGEGGVSATLGEDQLGGSTFAFRASVGR